MLRHLLTLGCFAAFACSLGWGQITNVTNDQSTPTPGVGHDYIKMLSETVNPGNGSVSIRIQVPMPKGRRLTIPFAFAYDSNGLHHLVGGPPGSAFWSSNKGNFDYLEEGGWSYSAPIIDYQYKTRNYSPGPVTYSCSYYTDFMFEDPTGGRHALGLAFVQDATSTGCTHQLQRPYSVSNAGDDYYRASTSPVLSPVTVADADGTVYTFSSNLATQIEDRNGNRITTSSSNNGAFTYTDTLGRAALTSSGFGQSGNTILVEGLSQPYTIYWGKANTNFPRPAVQQVGTDPHCTGVPALIEQQPVITAIKLPNGLQYTFNYESTFGLLSEIDYPTGGKVKYTWNWNALSDFGAYWDGTGAQEACEYQYPMPAVQSRTVFFDGTTPALEQDFTYATNWNGAAWTSKTTTVVTKDFARDPSGNTKFQTSYTYSPFSVPPPPNDEKDSHFGSQIPLEQRVSYQDGGSHVLRTVNKTWYDQYELKSEQRQLDNNLVSETDYTYGPGAQVTEKDEYDYGSGARGSLLRKTLINYASFSATPIYSSGPSIFDRPSSIISYDGSGTRVAETDYVYDGASLTGTSSVTGHDYSNYSSSYNNRGNATQKTQWFNTGSSPVTKYTYDDTGQMLSMTDPNVNTTQYSYADNFTNGSPPGPTNAYLTKITRPSTNCFGTCGSVSHVESFTYNYPDGQLSSSTDQNSQKTSYYYESSLGRLDEIDYPDQGQTTFGYDDAVPSVRTTKKLSISDSPGPYDSTTIMNGVGHVIQTQLKSDPAGEDDTDTTYDGEGRVWKQSNPHRSGSSPSDGTTTYNYDALGRVTLMIPPDGTQTSNNVATSYSGNCATVTDEQSNARKSCADGLGRTTQVFEDPSGYDYETDYQYDALDNLTAVIQGSQKPCLNNTVSRSFVYDSLSRLTNACTPESGTTTYTYDANGNVLTKKDARGITTQYSYDELNRLVYKGYLDPNNNTLPDKAAFYYDDTATPFTGNLTLANTTGRLAWTVTKDGSNNGITGTASSYDVMGRVLSYWQCPYYNCQGSAPPYEMSYTYDLAGDVTSWTFLPTNPSSFTITNYYNSAGQISQIRNSLNDATNPGLVAAVTYTPFGAVQTLYNDCGGSGCIQPLETYTYNNRLQPVVIQLGHNDGDKNPSYFYCLAYNYYSGLGSPTGCAVPAQGSGNNGNVMGYWYGDNITSSYSHVASYGYDSLNRLTSGVATGSSAYNLVFTYDRYGNMACELNGSTNGPCPQWSYNAGTNQIAGFSYDAAGNLLANGTGVGTQSFTWDAEERMSTMTNNGGGSVTNVTHNALGQQTQKAFSGYQLQYLYDPWGRHIATYSATQGAWWHQIIRLGDRVLSYTGGSTFLHENRLDTSTVVTYANGNFASDQLLYPFGQQWQFYSPGQIYGTYFGNMFGEPDSPNLYKAEHRMYDEYMGRWLTPDPAGKSAIRLDDPQSWNAYAYARNNPATLTDPTGLYTANCNGHVKNCSKQITNFDKSLQSALKSKNADIRKAAEAYGALGEKNGVNVTFAKIVDPKHADVTGTTSAQSGTRGATYDERTNTFQQATQVTIKAGLGGSELQETAVHEGVHVEDRAAFVNSIRVDAGSFDRSLNITGRQSEINAYSVENAFRRSMGLPTLGIQDILAHPPYSDNPGIDRPLFPDMLGPQ